MTATSQTETTLPLAYRWFRAHGITSLTPWHFVDEDHARESLRMEYRRETAAPNPSPEKDIWPFARRQDCDDVAAFVVRNGQLTDTVVVVHVTWAQRPEAAGWPSIRRYANSRTWLVACALDESFAWANEEELSLVLQAGA